MAGGIPEQELALFCDVIRKRAYSLLEIVLRDCILIHGESFAHGLFESNQCMQYYRIHFIS